MVPETEIPQTKPGMVQSPKRSPLLYPSLAPTPVWSFVELSIQLSWHVELNSHD